MSQERPIGERLREERERLGLNQTELGARGGVSRKTQFNYESGERLPDAAYLAKVMDAGVDVLYVVTGNRSRVDPPQAAPPQPGGLVNVVSTGENPLALTADEAALLDNYRHSSEAGKRAVEAAAAALALPKSDLDAAA